MVDSQFERVAIPAALGFGAIGREALRAARRSRLAEPGEIPRGSSGGSACINLWRPTGGQARAALCPKKPL